MLEERRQQERGPEESDATTDPAVRLVRVVREHHGAPPQQDRQQEATGLSEPTVIESAEKLP